MRKLFLLVIFLFLTPLFFLLNVELFFYYSSHKNLNYLISSDNPKALYAALPTSRNSFYSEITQNDARVEIVRQFFAKYNSDLEPFAQNVIDLADKYNIDYRFIPSIAMQESNLCKKIPANSYNCWGFGIYGNKVIRFKSYPEAIETVTKTLAKYYKGQGLNTPEEIMKKYTPPSNGSWAKSVNQFMNQLDLDL